MTIVLKRRTTTEYLDDQDNWTPQRGDARCFSDSVTAMRYGVEKGFYEAEMVFEFEDPSWNFQIPIAAVFTAAITR